jgi:diamine N-acetyltransferase
VMNAELKAKMVIRKLALGDLQQRVDWMNNPLVYKSMHFDVPVLIDKTIEWYNRNQQREDRVDCVFFDDAGDIVAFGGITSINKEIGKGETYIFTNPKDHHKGIGTEAMKLLCKYGFETVGLNKLYAYTNEDNAASIRLHQKVGYEIEGRLRQEYKDAEGTLKDRIYLGYLRQNYSK